MIKLKKTPLTMQLAIDWSQKAHAIYLDCLMSEAMFSCKQIAFHGGTSLHLSWRSSRHSEDLDFLLSKEVDNLGEVSTRILKAMQERFFAIDPGFIVEMRDKTKNAARMPLYHLIVSHESKIGNVMVKAEFWRVDANYLKSYPTEFKTPVPVGDTVGRLSNPVPAAKLETAYCDKLTAFATRPHLKWRDIYDLWWIGTQTSTPLDMGRVLNQFEHNLSAYTTLNNLPPAEALREFLKNDKARIFNAADPDIKKWLPQVLWDRLYPDGIQQMIDYVFYALESVSQAMDNRAQNIDKQDNDLKIMP